MELAKPGTIQHMCAVNAIATLQEYLDDYASDKTKREAAEIIKSRIAELDPRDAKMLSGMLEEIGAGKRDVYR